MKSPLNCIQIFSGIFSTTLQRISFSFVIIDLLNDTSRMSVGSCALRTEQSVSCYHELCFIQWEISESLWILLWLKQDKFPLSSSWVDNKSHGKQPNFEKRTFSFRRLFLTKFIHVHDGFPCSFAYSWPLFPRFPCAPGSPGNPGIPSVPLYPGIPSSPGKPRIPKKLHWGTHYLEYNILYM